MKRLVLSCFGATLIGLLAPTAGQAAVTVYTTPTDYAAATTANTTYSFPNTAGGFVTSYTDGPLTFSSPILVQTEDPGFYGSGVGYLRAPDGSESIALNGATALSFTLGNVFTGNIVISINGAMVATLMTSGTIPATGFIGFTDTVPITSLTFSTQPVLDTINFQVGSSAVPEPSTWAMLSVGIAGAGFVAWRRRQAFVKG